MNKAACITVFAFMIAVSGIMAYPLYSIFKSVNDTLPVAYREYTVLDLKTGKKMIVVGDDNAHRYHANDTALRVDRILYPYEADTPVKGSKVVIIASYNQLYQ